MAPFKCPENAPLLDLLQRKKAEFEAKPTGERLALTLHKVIREVTKHPIPILSEGAFFRIKGVGEYTCKLTRKYWEGLKGAATEAPGQEAPPAAAKPKKKRQREYVPGLRTAGFALLITLYRNQQKGQQYMLKKDLMEQTDASGLCDTPIAPKSLATAPGRGTTNTASDFYSGWSTMQQLINKCLVLKDSNPAKYSLLEEGVHIARTCLKRAALPDPLGPCEAEPGVGPTTPPKTAGTPSPARAAAAARSSPNVPGPSGAATTGCSGLPRAVNTPPSQGRKRPAEGVPEGGGGRPNPQVPRVAEVSGGGGRRTAMGGPNAQRPAVPEIVCLDSDDESVAPMAPAGRSAGQEQTSGYRPTDEEFDGLVAHLLSIDFPLEDAKRALHATVARARDTSEHLTAAKTWLLTRAAASDSEEDNSLLAPCPWAPPPPRPPPQPTTQPTPHPQPPEQRPPPAPQVASQAPPVQREAPHTVPPRRAPGGEGGSVLGGSQRGPVGGGHPAVGECSVRQVAGNGGSLLLPMRLPPLPPGMRFGDVYDVCLLVDDRELVVRKHAPRLQAVFRSKGLLWEKRNLLVGDFMWVAKERQGGSGEYVLDYVVERKRVDDHMSSIVSGRYHTQKLNMKRCGLQRLIYLAEDDPDTMDGHQTIKTALVTTELEGYDIQRTRDANDTVQRLALLTAAIQGRYCNQQAPLNPIGDPLKSWEEFTCVAQGWKKKQTLLDMWQLMLTQIQGIAEDAAVAITAQYKTPAQLAAAYAAVGANVEQQKQLLAALKRPSGKSIGKKAAENVWRVFGDCNHADNLISDHLEEDV